MPIIGQAGNWSTPNLNAFKLFYWQIVFENDDTDNHKMLNIGADNQSTPNNAVVTPVTLQCVHSLSVFQPKNISNITVNCSK